MRERQRLKLATGPDEDDREIKGVLALGLPSLSKGLTLREAERELSPGVVGFGRSLLDDTDLVLDPVGAGDQMTRSAAWPVPPTRWLVSG